MRHGHYCSIALIAVIIAILVFWSLERNRVYQSEISLWEDNVSKSPNKTRPLVNLAFIYKKAGREQEGFALLTKAMTIDPDLAYYFAALRYVDREGGQLITEKDPWK